MTETKSYRCACGCGWNGPIEQMRVVETIPHWLRESHEAAGNAGRYPHNGAERLALEESCATTAVECDPEWTNLRDVDPAKYAEESEDPFSDCEWE